MLSSPCTGPDTPRGLQKFQTPRIFRQSAREGGKFVRLTHRKRLHLSKALVLISVRRWVDPRTNTCGQKNTNDPIENRTRDLLFCNAMRQPAFSYSLVLCTSSVLVSLPWLPRILPFVFHLQYTTQTPMPPAGFEPETPASDRPQILALDRSATGIGNQLRHR